MGQRGSIAVFYMKFELGPVRWLSGRSKTLNLESFVDTISVILSTYLWWLIRLQLYPFVSFLIVMTLFQDHVGILFLVVTLGIANIPGGGEGGWEGAWRVHTLVIATVVCLSLRFSLLFLYIEGRRRLFAHLYMQTSRTSPYSVHNEIEKLFCVWRLSRQPCLRRPSKQGETNAVGTSDQSGGDGLRAVDVRCLFQS